MKNILIALGVVATALLTGCKSPNHVQKIPEFISIDGSGPAIEKVKTVVGTPMYLSSECATNRVGVMTLISVKLICEPMIYEGKPVKAPFNPADFKSTCGNLPTVYFKTGEPIRLMLVRTSDSVPTKDFLEKTLKIEKEDVEGASLMIIQDIPQPKYVVTCDRNASIAYQRTSTIPEGKFKTDALTFSEKMEQYIASQNIPQ
ncbi:hypothetical protein UJ39_17430 [Salmonella enterica subsp. enterica serovar Tennessee]|nr:hypothetical protein [Salmonella enterica]EED5478036.1 hypothetical protein [Salmonella enterica subsp. enterica serovar Tennessee]